MSIVYPLVDFGILPKLDGISTFISVILYDLLCVMIAVIIYYFTVFIIKSIRDEEKPMLRLTTVAELEDNERRKEHLISALKPYEEIELIEYV